MSILLAWGSPVEGLQFIADLAEKLAGANKTSWTKTSLELMKLIRKGQFDALVDFELKPSSFSKYNEYYLCAQLVALYKKVEDLPIQRDRKAAAWEKFVQSEKGCLTTNIRFLLWERGEIKFTPRVEALMFQAQRKISRVLGVCPSIEQLQYRMGSGAVRRVPKRIAVSAQKLKTAPNCSSNCVSLAQAVLAELPRYAGLHASAEEEDSWTVPLIIERGRVSFVPKTAKIDRVTVTEPSLNVMIQLAIGDYMFDRLKRVGVDLSDQTKNQRLALEGSLTGALATLDLSSASDSISIELVRNLLPYDWCMLLESARSSTIIGPDKEVIALEKFSSMGNGFTFPLESLIFWALISAICGEENVSVYGDDLIVPSEHSQEVVELLSLAGFIINRDKSFTEGPFRESCGKDYFDGFDVRPLFMQNCESDALALFRAANYFTRRGELDLAAFIIDKIPDPLRLFGPDGFGDGHIVSASDPGRPFNTELGWGGRIFESVVEFTSTIVVPPALGSLLPVYHIYMRSDFEPVEPIPRNEEGRRCEYTSQKAGYKVVSIYHLTE